MSVADTWKYRTAGRAVVILTLIGMSLFASACSGNDDKDVASGSAQPASSKSKLPESDSVIDVANDEGGSTFVSVASTGKMMEALGDSQKEFTLLLPPETAMTSVLAEHPEYRDNEGRASFLVKMHLIVGSFSLKDLRAKAGTNVTLASGTTLPIVIDGDKVKVGWVTVTGDLSTAGNGKVLSVSGVLAPELADGPS